MNQALAVARGKFVVFGNADAAVTPFWLEGMLDAAASAPRVGGVSPCSNPPGGGRAWSRPPLYRGLKGLERFASATRLMPAPSFLPVEGFVPGFWFMTERALATGLGGFDERFSPGGFEDWDLQARLREAGRSIGFADRAPHVHHLWFGCGRSNGLSSRAFYGPSRRRLFESKHPGLAGARMAVRSH
jgi:GT2 family glycosyltransferase